MIHGNKNASYASSLNHKRIQLRPKTAMQSNYQLEQEQEHNKSKDLSLKNIAESVGSYNTSKENNDIIDSILQNQNKETYQRILDEESKRLSLVNRQKIHLENLNLIEDNIEGLYEWNTLFNKSRPLSSYTKVNYSANNIKKETQNFFKFPLALIDASEDHVMHYIPSLNEPQQNVNVNVNVNHKKRPLSETSNHNNNSNKNQSKQDKCRFQTTIRSRKGNATRPQSMYSTREKNEAFYLSKVFSDYYTEDLKAYSNKVPLLQPRLPIDKKKRKLHKTIKILRRQASMKEQKYRKILMNDTMVLSPLLLSIAGNMNNIEPLLKSIYQQTHSNKEEDIDKRSKLYFKTASRLGSTTEVIDYTNNNRTGHMEEITLLRQNNNYNNTTKDKLILPTYDESDPQLNIFKTIKAKPIIEENQDNEDDYDKEVKGENIYTHVIESACIKTRNKPKIMKRPNTGHRNSKSTQSKNNARLSSTKKSQTQASTIKYNDIASSYKIDNFKSSHKTLNFSSSMSNTCASLTGLDYIPNKGLPYRTLSVINNQTYQRIDRNMKHKRSEIGHNNNYNNISSLIQMRNNVMSIGNSNKVEAVTQTHLKKRPQSSLLSTPIEGKFNGFFSKLNNKTNNNNNTTTSKKHLGVNHIVFDDFIDTKIEGVKGFGNDNDNDCKQNSVRSHYAKHPSELNYHPVNCFNRGTCIRNIGNKRISFPHKKKERNYIDNKNNKALLKIYNCK